MSTATTAVAAGNSVPVYTASMERRGDGTINFKHFIKNAKKLAKHYPFRDDQKDGPEVLKTRLDDDVEEFEHSIFDICSNEKLVRAVRKLILNSGKKKSNLMANLQLMHSKYKDELEKDDDLQLIYSLLSSAGITGAFMNFYPPGGNFKFHRDHFLSKAITASSTKPHEPAPSRLKSSRGYFRKIRGVRRLSNCVGVLFFHKPCGVFLSLALLKSGSSESCFALILGLAVNRRWLSPLGLNFVNSGFAFGLSRVWSTLRLSF
jgi:hypothetical protein